MENGMDPTQAPDLPENADAPLMLRPDPEKLKALGRKLASDFEMYERDRRTVEMRWAQNLRQFLGKYDPEIAARIPKERSRAYPKLTRIKCVSMVSRLMNLLFPSSEKNWGVEASPVPNLSVEDLQQVLDSLQQDPNAPITDDAITDAVNEFAAMRAENLEVEVEDQLAELGGGRMVSYIHLNRKVLMSGIMYGMGVLKGPQARTHPSNQDVRRARLDDVVVGTHFEAGNHVGVVVLCRDHDNRCARRFANASAHFNPVDSRKHDIEQHQIGIDAFECLESAGSIRADRNLEAGLGECDAHHLCQIAVVIDNKHVRTQRGDTLSHHRLRCPQDQSELA
jgi:hypothetical protein